jgi:hypothetical protein
MMTLPVFALLFVPLMFGFSELYPWMHESDEILRRKEWWLNSPGFYLRAIIYFVIWSILAWFLYSWSTKQDKTIGDNKARDTLTRKLWRISTVGTFLFAITLSLQSIDWMMSLQPHWYSTIFGVYYFAGAILAFYAFTILVMILLQKTGLLITAVTAEHYHDLGKFLFGHVVFWAYIAFSQFFLIWYANIPEEVEFFLHRMHGGWEWVSYGLPIVHFFIPFLFLLSRHIKRNKTTIAIGASYVFVVHMLDFFFLIMPNFAQHGEHPHLEFHWLNFTALVGTLGIFFAAFAWLLKRNSVVCINDPRLEESLVHENY